MPRLLVVDDEPSIREIFSYLLDQENYIVDMVENGRQAIEYVSRQPYDLVITDLSMPELDGMKVLEKVKELSPETAVLMITAYGTAESAVEAMKAGAYDYVLKPFKIDEIRLIIKNALERSTLRRENEALKLEVGRKKGFSHFIGTSSKMMQVYDLIERVASGRSSVLVAGESGTGKELVAKAIHENSPRSDKPFVSINCAAIPETLIESELFGYVKGAFTGASSNKMGLFEAANQGTIFLDEIADLPSQMQVKLLRVLQERTVRRLGSNATSPIDIRIISATNVNLEEAVKSGKFREDLFYRLNVIQIRLPALRERREDIPILAQHFLEKFAKEQGKVAQSISAEAMARLVAYDFPGNVRELENMMEQCVALEKGDVIQESTLPEKVIGSQLLAGAAQAALPAGGINLESVVDSFEKKLLLDALKHSGGIKTKAAELLQISFRSMRYRLLKHGIDLPDEEEEK